MHSRLKLSTNIMWALVMIGEEATVRTGLLLGWTNH